ncbi:hypothetical protein SAMN05216359_102473 [Roseateles sp. YR242]|uniref:hypothetical protein n=1 Tax=Roseateles sp. YR242 TaxID=1855305 RepID=UPI0008C9BB14|nr:hypothetical protein [Roseateles sp. YR242]SEK63189.1 hypothetical protein SAMN05216359_102473 [Roseateles sp. YR242]
MTEPFDFDVLIAALRERVQAPSTDATPHRLDLIVNDTPFSLLPAAGFDGHIDAVAVFGDVGPLPQVGRAEAAIQLLESNLYLAGTGAPFYGCHPERPGHVLLSGRLPLHRLDPDKALEALSFMATMAEEAREWLAPGAHPQRTAGRDATAELLQAHTPV